jgi:hypothetical protein
MTKTANRRRYSIAIATIAIAVAADVAVGLTTSRSMAAGPDAAVSPRTDYLPSISDLMIATIQPRHERLWRAQQDGDWEFAAYELGISAAPSGDSARPIQPNTTSPCRT